MPKFQSTKTYGTDRGLSCCFRQWKATHSHCSTLHGYSLGFKFIFESETLDSRNWAFDFGGMKPIKSWLDYMFDHTVLVAEDDPALEQFKALASFSTMPEMNGVAPYGDVDNQGINGSYVEGRLMSLRIVPGVGCEMTAKMVYERSCQFLEDMKQGKDTRYEINPDVRLVSVECFEHGSNSAIYFGDEPETKVHLVDVDDMDPDCLQDYLEHIRENIRNRKTIDSVAIAAINEEMGLKPQVDGNLEPFVDQLMALNKVEPTRD